MSDQPEAQEPPAADKDDAAIENALALGGESVRRSRVAMIIVGVIALAALIVAVLNFGEINAFAKQAAEAELKWIAMAIVAQCGAFFCIAIAWRMVLRDLGEKLSLLALFPLSVAKLFADQALPSGGLSGAVFLLHALRRRHVAWDNAFTAFVFAALGAIAAFLVAATTSFMAIAGADNAPSLLTTGARAFYILLIIIIIVLIVAVALRSTKVMGWFKRIPKVERAFEIAGPALNKIAADKALFMRVTLVQLLQRGFDALTLWLAFFAIGDASPLIACFIAVSIASVAATIAPTPMGIGSFEGGMVASLSVFGVPVENALTVTLLYRGLSLWLPLIPGFYVIQRELLRARPKLSAANPTPGL